MTTNVVKILFIGREGKSAPIWRHDYGQIAEFQNISLPETFEVHFANSPNGNSTTSIGQDGRCEIPDAYLTSGNPVYGWIFLHAGEEDGETVFKFVIPVKNRAAITNAEPTPVQQDAITQAIAALNAGVEAAEAAEAAWEGISAEAETLPAGSAATASYADGVLSLGIPQGEKGDKGDKGDQGIQGIQGIQGEQGVQGVQGIQGETGATPDISIGTVTTLDAGEDATATIIGTAEAPVLNLGIPKGDPGEVTLADLYAILPEDTVSGAVANFPDGANNVPVKDLLIEIEPVQAGSGDPAPDNVRPITGWTGANVTRAGKNFIKSTKYQASTTNVILGQDNNTGFETALKAGTYTIKYETTGNTASIYMREKNDSTNTGLGTVTTKTFTIAKDGEYRFWLYLSAGVNASDISKVQIELGSTATAYETYTNVTYPVSWQSEAGTVYGGTLDVTTGVLTVDRAIVAINSQNLSWTYDSTYNRVTTLSLKDTIKKASANNTALPNLICSSYKTGSATQTGSAQINGTIGVSTGGIVYIADDNYQSAEAFVSGMGSQTIVYLLATPQTYQLTPQEIRSLLGNNNIWADTGNSSVTYRADIKKYIDKKTS